MRWSWLVLTAAIAFARPAHACTRQVTPTMAEVLARVPSLRSLPALERVALARVSIDRASRTPLSIFTCGDLSSIQLSFAPSMPAWDGIAGVRLEHIGGWLPDGLELPDEPLALLGDDDGVDEVLLRWPGRWSVIQEPFAATLRATVVDAGGRPVRSFLVHVEDDGRVLDLLTFPQALGILGVLALIGIVRVERRRRRALRCPAPTWPTVR